MTKYRFKIRARGGVIVDNLTIAGRDQADAERKLVQMYHGCQILECIALEEAPGTDTGDMDDILADIARQDHANRQR